MSMKKSVVLGALMAFAIAGSVSAAELSAEENNRFENLKQYGYLLDFNKDGSLDIGDYNYVKEEAQKAGVSLDEEGLKKVATDLQKLFGNANGADVTEIKTAFSNFLKNLDGGDVVAIKNAAQEFMQKIPADQRAALEGFMKQVINSGSDATGALGSISGINESLGKLVAFTNNMEQTLANATAKAEQLAGSIETNLSKVDQKINEKLAEVDSKISNFENGIGSKLDAVDKAIENNAKEVAEKLQENLDTVAQKVAQNATEVDNKIQASIDKYGDEIQSNIQGVAGNVDKIVDNVTDYVATNGVEHAEMKGDIAKNTEDIAANKTAIGENKEAIAANKTAIGENKEAIAANKTAIGENKEAIAQNKEAISTEKAERVIEDALIRSEIKQETGRLDNRITRLEDRVDKVGAMAAAIASLKTMGYDPEAPTEIAVGVGQYSDQTGMALGAFHYPNRDFMLNFNVSTAGDEVMGGMGATWKLGRKKAQANSLEVKLAKAEALKEAAKAARAAK